MENHVTRRLKSHPLWQLVLARLREFWREPAAIFWVYGFPLIMMAALGVAFRERPVEKSRVVIQQGEGAETVRRTLLKDERFEVEILDKAASRRRLRTGKVDLVVVPNQGDKEASAKYAYVFDPTRPGGELARRAVDDVLQRAAGREDAFAASVQEFDEPGGRYIDFLVPGLLGMGIMGGGLWGVGFAIVDMRIRKLLKRFLATPMRKSHFLIAVMISRFLFTVPEVVALLIIARIFFGVVNHGSYFAVGFLIALGSFSFAGIGLLIASRAQTLETVSGLMNLVMMPLWIASGIFFPTDYFPDFLQPAIKLLPLTPVIAALRQVMLEGAALTSLGGELALITAWGVVCFTLALRWFRWN